MIENDILRLGKRDFSSRLFVGTGKFPSNRLMLEAIKASATEMVTVAVKRLDLDDTDNDDMLHHIDRERVQFLPNTSGARDAHEALSASRAARMMIFNSFTCRPMVLIE